MSRVSSSNCASDRFFAQFATLREFVAAACANEIGLGNPQMEQARPRVGVSYPDMEPDLDREQFRALVAFVDTLPQPVRSVPEDDRGRQPPVS